MGLRPLPGVSNTEADINVCFYNSKFLPFWQIIFVHKYLQALLFCIILSSGNGKPFTFIFLYQARSCPMLGGLSLTWHWSPGTICFLLVLCLLYVFGLRRASTDKEQRVPIKAYHIVSFFSAIILIALVLLTPIDTIARTQLFSVHMAQAVILTTLCAPLVLLGCPAALLYPFVKLPIIGVIVRVFTRPLVASIAFNL